MHDSERILSIQSPKRRYALLAAVSLVAALGAVVWAYVEYVGHARASWLALAMAGALFGVALTIHFGFQAVFVYETVQGPRPTSPPAEAPLELGLAALGVRERRGFVALLGGAATSLLALLLLPLRSLGSSPHATLHATAWRRGVRLVTAPGGVPLRPTDLLPGSITPVVPGDAPDDTNSVAMVIRLRNNDLRVYSRICTHAGCAVCVFRSQEAELVCPCHYSVFDAARGGRVLSGPASQALPELPIDVDSQGFLVASGDFNRPIGPRCG
jgi:ubiquinol-cytochrome c reductase iron-sulfur subunit